LLAEQSRVPGERMEGDVAAGQAIKHRCITRTDGSHRATVHCYGWTTGEDRDVGTATGRHRFVSLGKMAEAALVALLTVLVAVALVRW
jgi:hypothetical protein